MTRSTRAATFGSVCVPVWVENGSINRKGDDVERQSVGPERAKIPMTPASGLNPLDPDAGGVDEPEDLRTPAAPLTTDPVADAARRVSAAVAPDATPLPTVRLTRAIDLMAPTR